MSDRSLRIGIISVHRGRASIAKNRLLEDVPPDVSLKRLTLTMCPKISTLFPARQRGVKMPSLGDLFWKYPTLNNAFNRVYPWDTHGSRGGVVQFCISFFFPREGGELFCFVNDFAGPRRHTHGICSSQCDRQGERCFTWYHGR